MSDTVEPTVDDLQKILSVFISEETDPPYVARAIVRELGKDYLRFLPESFDPTFGM